MTQEKDSEFNVTVIKYRAHLEMGYTIMMEHLQSMGYDRETSAAAARDEVAGFLDSLVKKANKELEAAS